LCSILKIKTMMKLTIFCFTCFLLTCNSMPRQDSKGTLPKESLQSTEIKTITVKNLEFKNTCFEIYQSIYPEVTGLEDKFFEKQLNDIFSDNFKFFIDSCKNKSWCDEADEEGLDFPSAAYAEFEILTNRDSIISILQIMTDEVGHGGNAAIQTAYVTTVDVKNRIIYGKQDFGIKSNNIKFLNLKIKEYFDKNIVRDELFDEINYPIFETSDDLRKVNFGVQNDSVIMIIDAFPTTHASYGIYLVPLKEFLPIKADYK
jgi:hypothetical protein